MNPEKFDMARVNRGREFKPGIVNLKGRNYDPALTPSVDYYSLKDSDRPDALKGAQVQGKFTVKQPNDRDRFYSEQRLSKVKPSDYTTKAKTVRLGGL